jgi:hypothetical protein
MMRMRLVLLLVMLAACQNPFAQRCGEETREVSGSARFPEANPELGYFQVDLLERRASRPGAPREQIGWVLMSEEFFGRITSATIIDRTTGATLVALPVSTGQPRNALQGLAAYSGTVAFGSLFASLRDDKADIRLETSIAGKEVIRQPLSRRIYHEWERPFCS